MRLVYEKAPKQLKNFHSDNASENVSFSILLQSFGTFCARPS